MPRGLSPSTFTLHHGESEAYNDVTPGSGYSILETPVLGWLTSYVVSTAVR